MRDGRIGTPRAVQVFFSYFNDDGANIRNQAAIGGGALYDIGCYAVLAGRYLFEAEPLRVVSLVDRDPVMGVDRLTSALLDFGAGRQVGRRDPESAVVKAAETAVREVVGKMKMDAALVEERDQIAPRVRALMQTILDRYKVGVVVEGVNLTHVRPPEQVQAAFDDVLKASQERDRAKNEAQAYANDVVPRARGAASRLAAEAEGYRARIVGQADGDAQRFRAVLTEYQKAPQVTRDRMYLDAMSDIYSNVTKVMVDSKAGSNLLYLPLDKLMQQVTQSPSASAAVTPPVTSSQVPAPATTNSSNARSRERESR